MTRHSSMRLSPVSRKASNISMRPSKVRNVKPLCGSELYEQASYYSTKLDLAYHGLRFQRLRIREKTGCPSSAASYPGRRLKMPIHCFWWAKKTLPRFRSKKTGRVLGIAPDVIREVFKRMGYRVKIQLVPWKRAQGNGKGRRSGRLFLRLQNQ